MKLFSKLIVVGLSVCLVHVAYADSCSTPCPKEECPKPCPPKPCPPKKCEPCPPKPCPKPCPPKKCEPCPPKPCKPCPPVCFEPGYPTAPECTPCAYNLAAEYELAPCPWNFWVDASFTYWQAYEEGFNIALCTTIINDQVQTIRNGNIFYPDTSFKPGFKVGLGLSLDHDHWSGMLEYAWFRSTTSNRKDAPSDERGGTPIWTNIGGFIYNTGFSSLSSKWRCNIDLLDALLTRPYYQGTHLIIAPFGGLRAQWIRQRFNMTGPVVWSGSSLIDPPEEHSMTGKSHSWAIGPKVGFQGEWHLGWGFRLEGDASTSLLFTRYTDVSISSVHYNGYSEGGHSNYDTLRAGNELTIGLGWGSYFDCRNYHLDILATYDFQIFWNQNMIRQYVDISTGHSPANLYLQGLTLRTQFDF